MHGSARWVLGRRRADLYALPKEEHCATAEYMEKLPDWQAELRESIRLHLATLKDGEYDLSILRSARRIELTKS